MSRDSIARAMSLTGRVIALTAFIGPMSSTLMKLWKNSFSTSWVNPIRTGLGWRSVCWK